MFNQIQTWKIEERQKDLQIFSQAEDVDNGLFTHGKKGHGVQVVQSY